MTHDLVKFYVSKNKEEVIVKGKKKNGQVKPVPIDINPDEPFAVVTGDETDNLELWIEESSLKGKWFIKMGPSPRSDIEDFPEIVKIIKKDEKRWKIETYAPLPSGQEKDGRFPEKGVSVSVGEDEPDLD